MITEENRLEIQGRKKKKKKRTRNGVRRQKEGKGTPSGLKSISLAQGVGNKKKQDSMEQELKL